MKYAVTSIETQTDQEYTFRRTNRESPSFVKPNISPPPITYPINFSRTPKPMALDRVTVTYELDPTVSPTVPTGKIILNYLLMGGDPGQNVQTGVFDEEGYELEEPVSLYSVDNLRDEIARLGYNVSVYSRPFEEDDDKVYAWNTLIDFIDRQPNRIIYSEIRKNLVDLLAEIMGEDQVDEFVEVVEERVSAPRRSTAPIRHSGARSYSKSLRPPERKIVRRVPPAEEVIATRKRVVTPGRRSVSEEDEFYEEERYTTTPTRIVSRSPPRRGKVSPSSYSMSPR